MLDALRMLIISAAPASARAPGVRPASGFLDRARAIWDTELLRFEDRPITLGAVILFFTLLVAGVVLSRIISRLLAQLMVKRFSIAESAAVAIRILLFYTLVMFVVLLAMRLLNIPLTIFAVAGGALAIGIGIGSQNLVSNFISGLVLLIERPLRMGDIVEVEGVSGIVRNVGARSTTLLRNDNVDILVPNSKFLENSLTNWTLSDDRVRAAV